MKKILFALFFLSSCASSKVPLKKINFEDLKRENHLYALKNNSYFYFMIDKNGDKHLVKMHALNSQRVIWIEKLVEKK